MVQIALFTSVLCVVAPFSLPLGPIPLSLATLAVYLAAGVLDWKYSAVSVALYIMLGAIGLPVFTNFEGGIHKIAGVTGGFIIGYIPCALAIGLAARAFGEKRWSYVAGMVVGTVLLYTCGTVWFMFQTGNSVAVSLTLCVTPFLVGDTVKIIVSCIAAPKLRDALSHVSRK